MGYQVRNKKNDDGSYTLSYGRGKKKLTENMGKANGKWYAGKLGPFSKMKDCKEKWGEWAATVYEKGHDAGSSSPAPPTASGPPAIKKSSGPPRIGKTQVSGPPKISRPPTTPFDKQFHADPLDPRFRNEDKLLTPLGVLLEIEGWARRYQTQIKNFEKDIYPATPFTTLLDQVQQTIARECPDLIRSDNDDARTQRPATGRRYPKPYDNPDAQRALDEIPEDDIPF